MSGRLLEVCNYVISAKATVTILHCDTLRALIYQSDVMYSDDLRFDKTVVKALSTSGAIIPLIFI